MNRTPAAKRTTLFLIELAICLGVFAFCAAVCLNLFAQAKRLTCASTDLTAASVAAQSAAEVYRAADGDLEVCANLLGATPIDEGLRIGYDENWQKTNESPQFWLEIAPKSDGHAGVTVRAVDSDEPIFAVVASAILGEVQP
ncbi:MAG: hypothetical protein IKU55_02445 [Clostridia bacterium]|nr:hypothetical protein [Clostridia bacterium]